jgi:D-Tyr-tRNAtyr deacylase
MPNNYYACIFFFLVAKEAEMDAMKRLVRIMVFDDQEAKMGMALNACTGHIIVLQSSFECNDILMSSCFT